MAEKRAGRWLAIIAAALLPLLLVAVSAKAAERQVVLGIEGMDCELCTLAIKKSLAETSGVKSVKVSYKDKKAWVTADASVTDTALIDAVKKAGFKARIIERK